MSDRALVPSADGDAHHHDHVRRDGHPSGDVFRGHHHFFRAFGDGHGLKV